MDLKKVMLDTLVKNLCEESDLSDWSSSSSDNCYINMIPKRKKLVRVKDFMSTVARYSNDEFRKHFRLSRQTATICIDELKAANKLPTHTFGPTKITAQQAFLMTLWYLSNQETYRQIADRFDVSESTAHGIIKLVVEHLVEISPSVIIWPNQQDAKVNEIEFHKKQGLRGVIGAIDGSHILINRPKINPEVYCNRKGSHSILLQAVSDHRKRFMNIFCGEAGSLHDARLLKRSNLYDKAVNGDIEFGNWYLLGDSAYPNLNWLVTPFKDNGQLTAQQRVFNFKHSSTRMVIENAFGLLKGRFRRLRHFDNRNISFVVQCVIAACVLHNICINTGESEEDINLYINEDSDSEHDEDNLPPLVSRRQQVFDTIFNL